MGNICTKFDRIHPLVTGNICAKFDQNTLNGVTSSVHMIILNFVYCDLDLRSLTSKINGVHPLAMYNMSTKSNEDAHNCIESIAFIFSQDGTLI